VSLAADDRPTAIQIYGADPALLLAAARIAARADPAFLDLNCGCWVPSVAGRGAGAGWLRDPAAMVEMARRIVAAVDVPVTVVPPVPPEPPTVPASVVSAVPPVPAVLVVEPVITAPRV